MRVKVIDYWKVRRDINAAGLNEIRKHIRKHHPRAVSSTEQQLSMLKSTLSIGPTATAVIFGVAQSTCATNVGRWWNYAKEVLNERLIATVDPNGEPVIQRDAEK